MLNSRKHNIEEVTSKKSGRTIGVDEPIFLFRAQDSRSVRALSLYADSCNNLDQFEAVMDVRADFIKWQKEHPELVKEPSI